MDRLSAMFIFRRVVESGSFTSVGEEAGLSQPTVSKQVAALERHLNSKLLNRSTRQLTLTEAGKHYYESCVRILDEIAETESRVSQQQTEPTGTLPSRRLFRLVVNILCPASGIFLINIQSFQLILLWMITMWIWLRRGLILPFELVI